MENESEREREKERESSKRILTDNCDTSKNKGQGERFWVEEEEGGGERELQKDFRGRGWWGKGALDCYRSQDNGYAIMSA